MAKVTAVTLGMNLWMSLRLRRILVSTFPTVNYQATPWYRDLTRQDEVPVADSLTPVVLPSLHSEDRRKGRTRRPRKAATHISCSFNSLTLSPANACKGGGLFVPAMQAQLARSFSKANVDAIRLHECRLPSGTGLLGGHVRSCVFGCCEWS